MDKFTLKGGHDIILSFTIKQARKDLAQRGIHILGLTNPEKLELFLMSVIMDDNKMIDEFILQCDLLGFKEDEALDMIEDRLEEWRKYYYDAVVNFSPPQVRKILEAAWVTMMSRMKDLASMTPEEIQEQLNQLSTSSMQSPESAQMT